MATYAARASEELRAQGSMCKRVRVSIRTGMFNPAEPKFAKGVVCELPYPTDETRYITRAAIAGLEHVYREGLAFSKAEVLLMDLRQRGEYTDDLFAETQPATSEKVMGVLDAVNAKWARNALRPGRVTMAPNRCMRREMMSQSYTTKLAELWNVRCILESSRQSHETRAAALGSKKPRIQGDFLSCLAWCCFCQLSGTRLRSRAPARRFPTSW